MKLKDILNEGATDAVARLYKEASEESDRFYNPEDAKYKDKNNEYYEEFFEQWFKDDIIPVFTKPVTKSQPEYTVIPKEEKVQSAGYRGLQYALAAAGLPYNHKVQKYETDPAKMLMQQTMNAAQNNNGQ